MKAEQQDHILTTLHFIHHPLPGGCLNHLDMVFVVEIPDLDPKGYDPHCGFPPYNHHCRPYNISCISVPVFLIPVRNPSVSKYQARSSTRAGLGGCPNRGRITCYIHTAYVFWIMVVHWRQETIPCWIGGDQEVIVVLCCRDYWGWFEFRIEPP